MNELSLFNLKKDPGEAHSVAGKHPEVVDRLKNLIEQARAELGDYDRIGSDARFYDEGPQRPGLWRGQSERKQSKPVLYDEAEPVGDLRFTFETGDLQGWTILKGKFDRVITDRQGLPNHKDQPFNKQGRFLVFTGHRTDRKRGEDSFTGVIESPAFVLQGKRMSFLVGGGKSEDTYVALHTEDGRELLRAHGLGRPALKRVIWDVGEYQGRTLQLRIVDESTGGWGQVTFDDFSCQGEIVRTDAGEDSRP